MKGTMKKVLALALVAIMGAGLIRMPVKTVKAASDPQFDVRLTDSTGNEITKAAPGDTIRATVSVTDAEDLTGFVVRLYCDKSKLTIKGGRWSTSLNDYAASVCDEKDEETGEIIHEGTATEPTQALNYKTNPYVNATWGVANKDIENVITTKGMGNIDLFTLTLQINESVEGEIPFSIQRINYVRDGKTTPVKVKEDPVVKSTLTVEKPKVPLEDFSLSSTDITLDLSGTAASQLSVTGYTPENTTDKENTVTWQSDAPTVAAVDENGSVTAVGKGNAVITASITNALGNTISKTCNVTVKQSPTEIQLYAKGELVKDQITLKQGQKEQLTAKVLPEGADNAGVTWSSNDSTVVKVSEDGQVEAVAEDGEATITAETENGVMADCKVVINTVHLKSIAIEGKKTIGRGSAETLELTYDPDKNNVTDEMSEPTWTSSKEEVATVDKNGTVTAVKKGTTTITATVEAEGKKVTATHDITVNVPVDGIKIFDSDKEIDKITVKKGDSKDVTAVLTPEDADTYDLGWNIDGTSHATIKVNKDDSKKCTITGVSKTTEPAIVTVTDKKSKKSATLKVTVTETPITEVKVTADKTKLNKGNTATATATVVPADTTDSKKVTWRSSNERAATVDSDGNITAVGGGEADIIATSVDREVSGSVKIKVSVPLKSISLEDGATELNLIKGSDEYPLKVTYEPLDTTVDKSKLKWSSDEETIATVNTDGEVTALKKGTTTIRAELDGEKASITVKVTDIPLTGITMSSANRTVNLQDGSFTLTYTQNTDNQQVTTDKIIDTVWTSSDEDVATVDDNGTVTLVGNGLPAQNQTTITVKVTTDADTNNTFKASCKVTVVAPLTGLAIMQNGAEATGTTIELVKGQSVELSALPVPDITTDDISGITWSSSDNEAVEVTTTPDGGCSVKTIKEAADPVTITAKVDVPKLPTEPERPAGTIEASVQIQPTEIHIESIAFGGIAADEVLILEKGDTKQLTVLYTPDNTTDAKEIATWKSDDPTVATVKDGLIKATQKGGKAKITAITANGAETSCNVNVPIHIESISVKDIEIKRGDKPVNIGTSFTPSNTTDEQTLTYELDPVSDEGAIILKGSEVTPVKAGTAKVIVTATGAPGLEKPSAVCTITVTEDELEEKELSFSKDTAGRDEIEGEDVHKVRIDTKDPHIRLIYAADATTDDVEIQYSVKPGSEDMIGINPASGALTLYKAGDAAVLITVTATNGAGVPRVMELEYKMNIIAIPLKGIAFAKDSQNVSVAVGEDKTLTIVYTPEDTTDRELAWECSDASISSITQGESGQAVIRGLKAGEVTVTATSKSGLKAETTVTITEKPSSGTVVVNPGNTQNSGTNTGAKAVKTGDNAHIAVYAALTVLALLAIAVVVMSRRKTKRYSHK